MKIISFQKGSIGLVVLVIVLSLVILGGVVGGAWYYTKSQNANLKSQNDTEKIKTEESKVATKTDTDTISQSAIQPIIDPGVIWLTKPKQLDDLNLFNSEFAQDSYTSYYKIADLSNGGEIIYVAVQEMGTAIYRFRKDANGKYYLLKNHSENYDYNVNSSKWVNTQKVDSVDNNTKYLSLLVPEKLNIGNLELMQKKFFFSFDEFYDTPVGDDKITPSNVAEGVTKKIGTTEYGNVYQIDSPVKTETENGQIKFIKYFVKLSDTSVKYFTERADFLADDSSIIGAIDDEKIKNKKFDQGLSAGGCGGYGEPGQYGINITADQLVKIGITKSNSILYSITDPDNPILKIAYETYKIGRNDDTSKMSYGSFVGEKPVLVWKGNSGKYYLFMDKDFAPNVECGKPVVYLYPEKETKVSVKVGADINISEPNYQNGWNVLAKPNGKLTWNGQEFDSLYWEGKGNGAYPEITQGRIVKTSHIEQELRGDLAKLGLNHKESQDFIDFWLPRMPKDKYTRLTWFGAKEMTTE